MLAHLRSKHSAKHLRFRSIGARALYAGKQDQSINANHVSPALVSLCEDMFVSSGKCHHTLSHLRILELFCRLLQPMLEGKEILISCCAILLRKTLLVAPKGFCMRLGRSKVCQAGHRHLKGRCMCERILHGFNSLWLLLLNERALPSFFFRFRPNKDVVFH